MNAIETIILIILIIIFLAIMIGGIYYFVVRKKTIPVDSCNCYGIVSNMNIPDFNIGNAINNQTFDQCRTQCNNSNCDWFNYESSMNRCWPKRAPAKIGSITGLRTPVSDTNCDNYTRLTNKHIPGFEIPNSATKKNTEEECQTACQQANCNWYTYDPTNKDCQLNRGTLSHQHITAFNVANR